MLYGRAVKVNPLIAIVVLLAGAQILGILGALLAIPVAASIAVVFKRPARRSGAARLDAGDAGPAGRQPARLSPRRSAERRRVGAGAPEASARAAARASAALEALRRPGLLLVAA